MGDDKNSRYVCFPIIIYSSPLMSLKDLPKMGLVIETHGISPETIWKGLVGPHW